MNHSGLVVRGEPIPPAFTAIDPGPVHCGVAHYEVEPVGQDQYRLRLVESYERRPDVLYAEIEQDGLDATDLIVCEDFRLQKGRNKQGSRVETPKVIGVIEFLAKRVRIPVRLQDPSVRSYAEGWLRAKGIDPIELGSNSHKRSAIVHGVYFVWRDKPVRERVRFVADRNRRGQMVTG